MQTLEITTADEPGDEIASKPRTNGNGTTTLHIDHNGSKYARAEGWPTRAFQNSKIGLGRTCSIPAGAGSSPGSENGRVTPETECSLHRTGIVTEEGTH